jgi:multidrug efflux pump subunit AcrA (membrane-fusion protein)
MTTEETPTDPTESIDPGKHRPRRMLRSPKTWLIVGLSVAVLAGVGVGSFFLFKPRSATTSRTQVVTATKGTQTQTVSLDGTLSPQTEADLNFSVSGTVTALKVKVGQTVAKGQVLATIDDSTLQDAVDLAAANLTSAKASYSDVSGSGTSAATKAAAAQVDSAKAALASAKQDLTNASLRSTIAGTVASVEVAVGDQISGSGSSGSGTSGSASSSTTGSTGTTGTTSTSTSSSAQIVVIATDKWKVAGTVGASDLSSLKAGQAATVTVNSTQLAATVASVGIVATSSSDGSATFPVVINVTGTQSGLYSGTTASAEITTGSFADVLTISTAAIITQNGSTVVNKVNSDGSTTVTTVVIGRVFGDLTEITSGLSEGDRAQITFKQQSTTSGSDNSDSGSTGLGGLGGIGGGTGGGTGGGQPPAGASGAGPNR